MWDGNDPILLNTSVLSISWRILFIPKFIKDIFRFPLDIVSVSIVLGITFPDYYLGSKEKFHVRLKLKKKTQINISFFFSLAFILSTRRLRHLFIMRAVSNLKAHCKASSTWPLVYTHAHWHLFNLNLIVARWIFFYWK